MDSATVNPVELPTIELGMQVEVRSRFVGTWCRGFEVVGTSPDGYEVRRRSDGAVLPSAFAPDEVRPA